MCRSTELKPYEQIIEKIRGAVSFAAMLALENEICGTTLRQGHGEILHAWRTQATKVGYWSSSRAVPNNLRRQIRRLKQADGNKNS